MGEFGRPFVGSVAVETGLLTDRQLRKDFDRICHDVYVAKGTPIDAALRAEAATLFAGDDGVLAGLSAACLHGSAWIDADAPAELYRTGSRRPVPGIRVHAGALAPDEFEIKARMLVTTPARTAFDLGRRRPIEVALGRLDALCRATELEAAEVRALAERYQGFRGVVQLRRALDLVDPGAESPQESRTRLLLVESGLPPPTTQIQVRDGARVVARIDMGWERWKVGVEYDGIQHWTDERQRTTDLERGMTLARLGWREVRVNSELLRERPELVVYRVRTALRDAGAPL